MPSPMGHALGGIAAGWIVAGPRQGTRPGPPLWRRPTVLQRAAIFAMLGMLPDVDFLFNAHSMHTHSIGAALVVALAAAALSGGSMSIALGCAAAYGSHILLDWLGDDTTPPIGIMALWPFTSEYYQSDLRWFMAISRRRHLPNFWPHNLTAVAREVVLLVPVVLLAVWIRRPWPGRAESRQGEGL